MDIPLDEIYASQSFQEDELMDPIDNIYFQDSSSDEGNEWQETEHQFDDQYLEENSLDKSRQESIDEGTELNSEDELDESNDVLIDDLVRSLTGSLSSIPAESTDDMANVHDVLENAMVGAVGAVNTTEFFRQVNQAIDQVTDSFGVGLVSVKKQPLGMTRHSARKSRAQKFDDPRNSHRHHRKKAKRNGYRKKVSEPEPSRPSLQGRMDAPHSLLTQRLRELRSMLRRYSIRGLNELDALEDTAELFAEISVDEALPILVGLTARVVVQPKLDQTELPLNSAVCQQLIKCSTQAVNTFLHDEAIQALPGLAFSVGKISVRQQLPIKSLPRFLQRSATRAVANPMLMKRFSKVNRTLASANQTPLHLQVSGPLELIIRTTSRV